MPFQPSLSFTGERAIPWDAAGGGRLMTCHMRRYAWAFPYCWQERVADLGCGSGYGTFLLSLGARTSTGVDISADAVAWANSRFHARNLAYYVDDVMTAIPLADVFVAFEVIEHLSEPQRLLDRIHGRLLYSIPIGDASEWHVCAYTVEDAEALIGGEVWYQSEEGDIAPRERAWFPARYVLGVSDLTS